MPATKNVLLVHGFEGGSCWAPVIDLLRAKRLNAIAIENPLSSLAEDAAETRRVLHSQTGSSLLVGHGWGGVVVTEAGNDVRAAAVVYIAAAAPDTARSFNDWLRGYPPPSKAADPDQSPEEAALVRAGEELVTTSCVDDRVTYAAWRHKRSWYLVTENDRVISPEAQIGSAVEMGAVTQTLAASHLVMLSQPDVVANFIARAAAQSPWIRSQSQPRRMSKENNRCG